MASELLLVFSSYQLDEMFAVVLSSHSTPASRLGYNRQVNITVRKSDDPFGVIQFVQPQLMFSINESKGMDIHSGNSFSFVHVKHEKCRVLIL